MDAHRLRSVFDLILAEHSRLEIDRKLARILQSLTECNSNPSSASDEQFWAVLTDLLATLRRSATNGLVESDRRILAEIGGEQFTGKGLAERVLAIADERPFLAGRAKEAFVRLADELQSRLGAVASAQASLSKLNVGPLELASDEYELGILLPDSVIKGDLEQVVRQLQDWGRFLKEFLPTVSEKPASVTLRSFTSTRFELSAGLDRDGALALGMAVAGVYEMFRTVRANRKRADDLQQQNYPQEIVNRFSDYEQQIVDREMKTIKEALTRRYVRRQAGRRKELDKLLERSLKFLALRIRDGAEVELVGPSAVEGAGAEGETVTHHVRAALRWAQQSSGETKESGEPGDNKETADQQRDPPRMPLQQIMGGTEVDARTPPQKAA